MKQGYRKWTIHSNKKVATNIHELKLFCPNMKQDGSTYFNGRPGQFYMIRGWEAFDPFLSRPISICNIVDGMIMLLYEVRGKGTHIISKLKAGDTIELLGPLGNGFDLNIKGNIALISGGIGMAPLIYLAKSLKGNIDFYAGFRDEVYCMDKIKDHVDNIFISTEDGSLGHKGFITEIFNPEKYDIVFTCGPIPMMKNIVELCRDKTPVYISMESRMACGIGSCLGCSIETISGRKRVCKEGPVFSGEEVVFYD